MSAWLRPSVRVGLERRPAAPQECKRYRISTSYRKARQQFPPYKYHINSNSLTDIYYSKCLLDYFLVFCTPLCARCSSMSSLAIEGVAVPFSWRATIHFRMRSHTARTHHLTFHFFVWDVQHIIWCFMTVFCETEKTSSWKPFGEVLN